jgi:hypothetical protein
MNEIIMWIIFLAVWGILQAIIGIVYISVGEFFLGGSWIFAGLFAFVLHIVFKKLKGEGQ